MSIGEILMRMTRKDDPAAQLAAALAPMQPGQPMAAQGAPAAGGGTAGTAAPAAQQAPAAPPAQAPSSPADLSKLYTDLMSNDRNARNIDSGLGLITSGLAEPENRDRIMKAFTGDSSDPTAMISNLLSLRGQQEDRNLRMNKAAQDQAARLATMARLPDISRRTGVPVEELTAMLNAGTLGTFLGEASKPSEYDETKDASTGQTLYVNKRDPNKQVAVGGAAPTKYTTVTDGTGQPMMIPENDPTATPINIGAPKPADIKAVQDGSGRIQVFDPNNPSTATAIGEPSAVPDGRTGDQKDYDRDMAGRAKDGRPLIPFDQWRTEDANLRKSGVTVNTGTDPRNAAFGKTWSDQYEAANASTKTIGNMSTAYGALKQGIIEGSVLSPLELTTRKLAGSIFGLDDATVNNTELYQSAMGSTVLTLVKELGTGNSISNADRDFAEKIAGGNIALNGESMQRIIRMQEKNARGSIIKYNREVSAAMQKDPSFTGGRMADLPPPSRALLDVAENARLPNGNTAIQQLKQDVQAANGNATVTKRELEEFNREFGPGVGEFLLGL